LYTDPTRFFAEHQGRVTAVRGVEKESHAARVARDLKLNFEFTSDTVIRHSIMIIGNPEEIKDELVRINQDIEERRKEVERKAEEDRRRAEETNTASKGTKRLACGTRPKRWRRRYNRTLVLGTA
jgi:hypothetical protein